MYIHILSQPRFILLLINLFDINQKTPYNQSGKTENYLLTSKYNK